MARKPRFGIYTSSPFPDVSDKSWDAFINTAYCKEYLSVITHCSPDHQIEEIYSTSEEAKIRQLKLYGPLRAIIKHEDRKDLLNHYPFAPFIKTQLDQNQATKQWHLFFYIHLKKMEKTLGPGTRRGNLPSAQPVLPSLPDKNGERELQPFEILNQPMTEHEKETERMHEEYVQRMEDAIYYRIQLQLAGGRIENVRLIFRHLSDEEFRIIQEMPESEIQAYQKREQEAHYAVRFGKR